MDYYALGRNIFSLNIPSTIGLSKNPDLWSESDLAVSNRISEGLISNLMSLRLMPQIRFLNGSHACRQIAMKVKSKM